MNAISLYQPWASAIAVGAKKHETRSWGTKYRGPLAIQASKRQWKEYALTFYDLLKEDDTIYQCFERTLDLSYYALPFGAVVCVCDLVDCVPVEQARPSKADRLLGDYTPGRFAWRLENVRKLREPVPFVGRQMFFNVPEPLLAHYL